MAEYRVYIWFIKFEFTFKWEFNFEEMNVMVSFA